MRPLFIVKPDCSIPGILVFISVTKLTDYRNPLSQTNEGFLPTTWAQGDHPVKLHWFDDHALECSKS